MSENSDLCIVATITADQNFHLSNNAPSEENIVKDFEAVKFTLDPAPPCGWKYDLNDVNVIVDMANHRVSRSFTLAVILNIDESNINEVKEMMEEEGYFDGDDGFNWTSAISYFIADTTIAPSYADFDNEEVDVDVMEIES